MKHDYILQGGQVCLPDRLIQADVWVENGKIKQISDQRLAVDGVAVVPLQADDKVIPGMIDTHIHGANGADIMDASAKGVKTIQQALFNQGVTGFLATTMTGPRTTLDQVMGTLGVLEPPADDAASVLGVHLEGPFIAADKMGAQNPAYIQPVNMAMLNQWHALSGQQIKKITFAPECNDVKALLQWCQQHQVVPSMGHSNCTAKQAQMAIKQGACQATHLFNAMSGLDHRHPGLATAVLINPSVTAELIVDGIHLAPEIVAMTYQIKGKDHLLLVTDAMAAQGQPEGVFDLGGQVVTVSQGQARLADGTLAGSVLTMNQALSNMMAYTHCDLPAAVQMASTNPAKSIGYGHCKGKIMVGYDADIAVLDAQYQVKQVFKRMGV